MQITLGPQYNVGETPTVILYIYINRHAGTWGPYPPGLPITSLCDLPLLFVYFQVNNGVLYCLDYGDIYIMALSVLVSML